MRISAKPPNSSFVIQFVSLVLASALPASIQAQENPTVDVRLRLQRASSADASQFSTIHRDETWSAKETAIIVCDVWDYHHSPNAVARLNEMVPRLEAVLQVSRKRGVTIIHSPSDCMDAYRDHPARHRASETPPANYQPAGIRSWCSVIPAEEQATYPIDQSDGGEDDDPETHASWSKKLVALGRNPNMPWQKQHPGINIDPQQDFISDQGDEVWNILEDRGIQNVVLVGVHTNMCVLGRPFGLRQMARNGKHVVLMRDMTDTMYNPARWPYVSHFEGTRRVISHIERFVCPTMTSDQWLGGNSFRFQGDTEGIESADERVAKQLTDDHWKTIRLEAPPADNAAVFATGERHHYRCVIRVPQRWFTVGDNSANHDIGLRINGDHAAQVWINGTEIAERDNPGDVQLFGITDTAVVMDDANLLVIRTNGKSVLAAPTIETPNENHALQGNWQFKAGDDASMTNIPLPAKFGASSNIVFDPPDPLWTPRALTRFGEFTTGIEGPACDKQGNVFAVNFGREGTIGKVTPGGIAAKFLQLPGDSIGNGIRFHPDGSFFVADYTGHNVLRIDPENGNVSIHSHEPKMNQPNDLAITPDGETLFASDPDWKQGTGRVWRIDSDGTATRLAAEMGTTNGIEVSPDGEVLYVNESKQRNVWAFDITPEKTLANKRLIHHFDDHSLDGMRCDIHGNLYITRHGKGTVIKMAPDGEILREIPVLGTRPTNLCFGGPNRCTVYVTEVDSQRLVQFLVDVPGRP